MPFHDVDEPTPVAVPEFCLQSITYGTPGEQFPLACLICITPSHSHLVSRNLYLF